MMEVGRRTLREWRANRNYVKQDMAKALGIHPSTYAKWEKNPEEIKICDAIRIAEVLHCNIKDIIFFEDEPKLNLDFKIS
ncbi:hypothetical protein ERIC1_1c34860 [Paenibacillus larvae subsp. larvae DSM 25719]|uniref:helix-turn-helix domain-containing protein n=1 Tax=Paenibacillus larvae TaxID=1464 RepID=UPI0003DCC7BE|nr:helix-turn-helix transcriptional regulator [Paenibacillus larvae]ETK29927.1 hypothetical protein ERIC1_1c34860 [Paenibacillus larvae subsp. larvae DSM 25719]